VHRREILKDGAVRLRADDCTFLFTRLLPRVLLLEIKGSDDGQLGGAPLSEMAAELDRFGPPLRLFADARATRGVAPVAQEDWKRWFSQRRGLLAGVDVLVPQAVVQLDVSSVLRLARADEFMRVVVDRAAFEAAIREAVPEFAGLPSAERFAETPVEVRRQAGADGSVQLAAGRCRFEYRRPRSRLVAVTIAGHDDGVLGAAPLDELMPDLRGRPGRLVLFVDARGTLGVATHVRDLWSAWFQAHRDKLETVHVLPGSRLVHLNIALSRQLSRTGDLIRLHTDAAEFDRALTEATG
jgi:hypothetical protein